MFDIWNKCSNPNCKLFHPRKANDKKSIDILQLIYLLNKNLFEESLYKGIQTIFYYIFCSITIDSKKFGWYRKSKFILVKRS